MADPGFLSGFIGKGIDIAINQILHHAGIAVCCKEELNALRGLVRRIEPIATRIHQYHLELNRKRGTPIAESGNNSSQWVMDLDDLLRRALPIVRQCTIPSFNVFARYQMAKYIKNLNSEIREHLYWVPLVLLEQQTQMLMEMRRESAEASSSTSASTSSFFIEDALIVGQEQEAQMHLEMRRESAQASGSTSASTSQAPTGSFSIEDALLGRLKLNYDALGDYDVNLQLCFLYLAAFTEDEIIEVEYNLIPLWIGEGLLERNERGHDPFEMGRIYANLLADRCLIEPVLKDADGRVVRFKVHDVLRDFAIHIAEKEEKFQKVAEKEEKFQ